VASEMTKASDVISSCMVGEVRCSALLCRL
jgi:hypothetical protein